MDGSLKKPILSSDWEVCEPAIRKQLVRLGWRPDRDVWDALKRPKRIEVFPVAQSLLANVGGLELWTPERDLRLTLKPDLADEFIDQILFFASHMRRMLYPIGTCVVQDEVLLLVDEFGVVHECEFWMEGNATNGRSSFELQPLASSFVSALNRLLTSLKRESHADWKSACEARTARYRDELQLAGLTQLAFELEERRLNGNVERAVQQVPFRWKW